MGGPISIDALDDQLLLDGQDEWKGGVNSNAHPVNIAEDELATLLNGEIRKPGQITLRRGSAEASDTITVTKVQALCYFKSETTTEKLIIIADGQLYYCSTLGGAWTGPVAGMTLTNTTTRVNLQPFVTLVGIFSGNAADNVYSFDGATITDHGSSASDPNPVNSLITCVQLNRIFAYVKGVVYYCNALNIAVWNRTSQAITIGSSAADHGTGLREFGENKILAGREGSMAVLDLSDGTPANWKGVVLEGVGGCIHHDTMAVFGKDAAWLGKDGVHTVFELDTGKIQQGEVSLSDRVLPQIVLIDFTKDMDAMFFDNYYLLAYTDIFNVRKILVYDWQRKAWAGTWDTWKPLYWTSGRFDGAQRGFYISEDSTGVWSVKQCLTGKKDFETNTYPAMAIDTRAFVHGLRLLEKETASIQTQFLVAFGTTNIFLIGEGNTSYHVATYTTNDPNVWGSLFWPILWTASSLIRKEKVVPKRRSLWWQVRITHSGGPFAIKQSALSAFALSFKMS